ncbi:CoA-binding protein [Zhouia amylolytica]|uniref:CoA-binding protein n=1 Tax=Zhouia amylolytica TaxID=376730 RepID=UPI0020CBDE13|nr:CoA-binding protein [Zhouia amylolytica]MCQ0110169.1 CoA-binding protein [Zhouia amylolytica]
MGKTLIMGASLQPSRYSYIALKRLRMYGESVVAFGKHKGRVADVVVEDQLIRYTDIDTVTLYLRPEVQKEFYDYILSLKPNRVIFNPGTENESFYELLEANKIRQEVACTLVLLSTKRY